MIEDEFGDWMQTISVEPFAGDGAWGESFADPQDVLAHWQYDTRTVITSDGKTVQSSSTIQCAVAYAAVLNDGARVTLPGDSRQYRVAAFRTWPGDDSHLEVSLV